MTCLKPIIETSKITTTKKIVLLSWLPFLLFLLPFFFFWLRTVWASAVCCKRPMNRSTSSKQWFRISWWTHGLTNEPQTGLNAFTSTGRQDIFLSIHKLMNHILVSSFSHSHHIVDGVENLLSYCVCKPLWLNLTELLGISKSHRWKIILRKLLAL